jgi:hypothetical protein
VGLSLYALVWLFAATTGFDPGSYWSLNVLIGIVLATIIAIIAGIVMVIIPRTRLFAAGLLLSIAIGLIADSGVCIALVAHQNG